MKKIIYFIATCVVLLTACEKGEVVESTPYEKIAVGDPKYSYIKILNLTPGSPILNYYIDGTKFSSGLSSTGIESSGFAYNNLFPDLGYAITTPGSHKLTGKIIPTAAVDPSLEIYSTTITPAAGKFYTIFTTGQYSTLTKVIPTSLIIEDIKPALDTSKIFVRLINLYNGGPNLDVVKTTATGTKIITNVAYGTASNWFEVPIPGPGAAVSFPIFFNDATTNVPLITAGSTITLTKGRTYTLYVRGVLGNPTYPFLGTFYTTFY
jgi:hypothetical protein